MNHYITAVMVGLLASACAPNVGRPPVEAGETNTVLPPSHVETTTADGEIIGVDRGQPGRELAEGMVIRLQTDSKQPIAVQLAPGWYLEEKGIEYGTRERLQVRGSRVMRQGKPVFIAREVKQGERWVPLRDQGGRPVWEGE